MRKKICKVCMYLFLSLLALTMLSPFLWMVLGSFKPLNEVENLNPIPSRWLVSNYFKVFEQIPFHRYYFNSIFVAGWVTFLQCLTSAMAAYAFSRLRWRGRDTVFTLYLGTLMVPGVVTMIPNFAVMVKLHLLLLMVLLIGLYSIIRLHRPRLTGCINP